MASFHFVILVGLFFILITCEGKIIPPPDGTNLTILPGSSKNITWTFDDDISKVASRSWSFTSSDGLRSGPLGGITLNFSPQVQRNILPGIDIKKPATLVLSNVSHIYDGTYTFRLSATESDESNVRVFIAKKPNVTFNCFSLNEVNEGDHFTCVCYGENGNPPASVTWYKGGVQINGIGKKNQTLILSNANKTLDNGTYKCEARTHANDSFADEKFINVIVRPLAKPSITSFTVTPHPVAKEGQTVTITCTSKGVPAPSNTIMRNGSKVSPVKTSTDVSTTTTYTISVDPDDAGIYTCIAENKVGNDSAKVNLTVKGQITPTPTTPTPSTSYAATSNIPSNGTGPAPTTPRTSASTSAPTSSSTGGLSTGAIIGIIIGVLVLIIIVVVVVVYYCKSKEKERSNNSANIDPVPGNGHELEEPGPSDGAYDTVWTSGSKSKAPVENALPPVYAAVDKNNRQGNTLYASLDNKALKSSRASKKEPDRPQQTEYASIDFAKSAPKAV